MSDIIINKIILDKNITTNDTKNEIILKVINYLNPNKYKVRYTDDHYLKYINLMLNSRVNWCNLKDEFIELKEYHYKTIYNKFIKWSSMGVFKISYEIMMKINYKFNTSNSIDLYIDSTFINNSKGSSCVGINPQYTKKKVTKISALCDENKNILSILEINSPTINDVKTIQNTIDNICVNVNKSICIVGDKGYLNKKKRYTYKNNKNKVQVHCPHRKNMKEKTPSATKKKLKKRYIIEHVFKDLKKYNRIYLRKEKDIKHYMSFMYLAVIKEFNKH
jgi:hypothetical protein